MDNEKIVLNSPQELVDFVLSDLPEDYNLTNVTFGDGFKLVIKLEGPQWQDNGFIDHRLAQYIINLQRDILGVYNEITGEHVSRRSAQDVLRPLTVKVRVESGSTQVFSDIPKVLTSMVQKMDSTDMLVAFGIGVAAWVAAKFLDKWWDARKAVQLKEKEKQISDRQLGSIDKAIAVADRAVVQAHQHQDGMRYLIGCMDKGDRLEMPQTGKTYSRQEAKQAAPKKVKVEPPKPDAQLVDDTFEVVAQDFRDFSVKISIQGYSVPASTSTMRPGDRKKLYEKFSEADINQKLPEIKLRVIMRVDPDKKTLLRGDLLMLDPLGDDDWAISFDDFKSTYLEVEKKSDEPEE
jgi:hypothetical protein